ncbi:hypothetical protein RR48_13476 [Papilio machaon]|uniref:Circadian clock-controlled protein n=1 Tax=Papilio machaon TaxID=76193 RepID=A0A194RAU4_PAPMA|nr:hypothetical protein RR48_13476 [Papilio machaon]
MVYVKDVMILAPQRCAPGDSECYITTNTLQALSQIGYGLREYGIKPLEPMLFKNVTFGQGLIKLEFPRMRIVGAKDCKVGDIKLNFAQSTMSITLECPVKITGKYKFNGNIYFYETSHEGNYVIKSDNIRTTITFQIDTIHGANGKRYWKLNVLEYVYEPQETLHIQLGNLFTGEVSKESPYFSPATGDWWPSVAKIAEPVASAAVGGLHGYLEAFYQHVPLEQLSNQILPRPIYDPRAQSIADLECFSFGSVSDLL